VQCHREEQDLAAGAVLQATLEEGEGDASPEEGDLVSNAGSSSLWVACCWWAVRAGGGMLPYVAVAYAPAAAPLAPSTIAQSTMQPAYCMQLEAVQRRAGTDLKLSAHLGCTPVPPP
jgi:hypothetical protein